MANNKRWSINELEILKTFYPRCRMNKVPINRSGKSIYKMAQRLGLKSPNRKCAQKSKDIMSIKAKKRMNTPSMKLRVSMWIRKYLKENGHPKGMLGKKHTDLTIYRMRKIKMGFNNPNWKGRTI